jgi:hypothetical protein
MTATSSAWATCDWCFEYDEGCGLRLGLDNASLANLGPKSRA